MLGKQISTPNRYSKSRSWTCLFLTGDFWVSQVTQWVKNPPAKQEGSILELGRSLEERRAWQPTPVFLTGESQGWRSLSGHSPYGRKELDMTEVIEHTCMHAQVIFMTEGFPRGHGRHLRVKKVAQRSHGYLRFFSCWIFNNHFPKDVMSDVNISPRGNVDY